MGLIKMKVCIPSLGNRGLDEDIGEHFGRVPTYTLVDTETNEIKIIDNVSEHMGGQGYPPEIIAKTGAEVLVCSGLGRRAVMMFEELGIMVYVGAQGKVKDAIQLWKDNRLEPATDENACSQHAYHGQGGGHGDGHGDGHGGHCEDH